LAAGIFAGKIGKENPTLGLVKGENSGIMGERI
jgi:hypothetical protein